MKAVNVLSRINSSDYRLIVDMRGQRQLHQYAVDRIIGVKPLNQRDQIALRNIIRQAVFEAFHPGFHGRLLFRSDINLACRIIADEHDRKTGLAAGCFGKTRHASCHALTQP